MTTSSAALFPAVPAQEAIKNMYDFDTWGLAPALSARLENNETMAARHARRGQNSQRRRDMLRYDGPHGARYNAAGLRNDSDALAFFKRQARRKQRLAARHQLQYEELPAARNTTPDRTCDLFTCGAAEDYVSGTYPYFDEADLLAYRL